MKYSQAGIGRAFVIRLEDGDKLPAAIEAFAAQNGVLRGLCILVGGINDGGRIVVGPEDGRELPPAPVLSGSRGQAHPSHACCPGTWRSNPCRLHPAGSGSVAGGGGDSSGAYWKQCSASRGPCYRICASRTLTPRAEAGSAHWPRTPSAFFLTPFQPKGRLIPVLPDGILESEAEVSAPKGGNQ